MEHQYHASVRVQLTFTSQVLSVDLSQHFGQGALIWERHEIPKANQETCNRGVHGKNHCINNGHNFREESFDYLKICSKYVPIRNQSFAFWQPHWMLSSVRIIKQNWVCVTRYAACMYIPLGVEFPQDWQGKGWVGWGTSFYISTKKNKCRSLPPALPLHTSTRAWLTTHRMQNNI